MFWSDMLLKSVSSRDREIHTTVTAVYESLVERKTNQAKGKKSKYQHFHLTCHSVCRGLWLALPNLKIETGFYLGFSERKEIVDSAKLDMEMCTHSWLITPDGAIIDPYPVGVISLGPLLIPTTGTVRHFGAGLYYPDHRALQHFDVKKSWHNARIFASK